MVSASTLTSWSRLPRSRDRRCRLCREPVRRTLLQPEHTDVFDVVLVNDGLSSLWQVVHKDYCRVNSIGFW